VPLGLLYLGSPVQRQRLPERAPREDFVTYLE
jgi:nitroreductase